MTAYAAYLTALALADFGIDSDAATRADMDAAADHANQPRPDNVRDRDAIRYALDTIPT